MAKKGILIAVFDGKHGYGDLLFALKLSQQLKNKYEAASDEVPPVYVVTGDKGKEKIHNLKGDSEFGIEILTPRDLAERTNASDENQIDVGVIIEGPAFDDRQKPYFLLEIEDALPKKNQIPLLMVTEYSFSSDQARQNISEIIKKRQNDYYFNKIQYQHIIYSGLNPRHDEAGILLSHPLMSPTSPRELMDQFDGNLQAALSNTEKRIEQYQQNTDLNMQYSHDIYQQDYGAPSTPASHFLKIHHTFVNGHDKNQDVIMVGNSKEEKYNALAAIKDQFIDDGFTRISFYNAETSEEETLHDTGTPGKTYRVIYTPSISHQSMMACLALSGPLFGATGDQSFGEAVSANKIIVYETLTHKQQLIEDYDRSIEAKSDNDPAVCETLHLLRSAKDDSQYQRLGELLRDPATQSKIIAANQAVLASNDLAEAIVNDLSHKKLSNNVALLRNTWIK